MGIGIGGTDMKFELLLSHWLRVTNIIYAALSSGVLAAVHVLIAAMILAFAMMKIQSRTIRMTVMVPNVRSVED